MIFLLRNEWRGPRKSLGDFSHRWCLGGRHPLQAFCAGLVTGISRLNGRFDTRFRTLAEYQHDVRSAFQLSSRNGGAKGTGIEHSLRKWQICAYLYPVRTVSWQMSTSRSKSRSSTFRKLSGKRMYISTAIWMMSREELKYRNGLAGLRGRAVVPVLPSTRAR